ncbi:hypothetical protein ACIP4Y_36730 [Streptomyces sp. NPDC088810]
MVLTSVVLTGLVACAAAVPLGVALHGWVIPAMGDSVVLRLPGSVTEPLYTSSAAAGGS